MVEARKRTVQGIEAITNKKGKARKKAVKKAEEDDDDSGEDEIMLRNRLPVFKTLFRRKECAKSSSDLVEEKKLVVAEKRKVKERLNADVNQKKT